MAVEAPDPRAQNIADRIMGKRPNADAEAMSLLVKGAHQTEEPDDEIEEDDGDASLEDDEADGGPDERDDDEELDEPGEDEPGDDDEEEEDTDDEEDGSEYEEVAYSDDDEVEVVVDGETRKATLRELKKAFSGEGAIEKRLKEATEARKEANAAREAAIAEVTTHRTNLMQTIQQLDQVLFMPMVDEPDPKLRATNINAYLMQKDAWEEDQKRIQKSRNDLGVFFQTQQAETAKAREAFRQEQVLLLAQKMPDIVDPVKGPKINRAILDAAVHYGFTPEQVAQVDNHGLFLMARDAARWLNLQKIKQNGGPVPSGGEKLRRRKRLRSGTVAEQKTRLVKSVKEQKALTSKAQKSGKVDDVAAMLISKARTADKGARRGRTS